MTDRAPQREPRLLSVAEVGVALGRSPTAVRHLVRRGRLEATRRDRRVFVNELAVTEFVEGTSHCPAPAKRHLASTVDSVIVRPYSKGDGYEVEFKHPRNGARVRVKSRVAGREASQRWGAEMLRKLQEEEVQAPGRRPTDATVAEFVGPLDGSGPVETFFGYHRAQKTEDSTLRGYKSVIKNWIFPFLGGVRVREVGASELQLLKDEMGDCRRKTINNALGILSGILTTARALDQAGGWDPPRVNYVKTQEPPVVFYSQQEWCDLALAAMECEDPNVAAVVFLGGDASLRVGETAAVSCESIVGDGVLLVRQARDFVANRDKDVKNHQMRSIPLTQRAKDVVLELKERRGAGRLLSNSGTGAPLRYAELLGLLRQAQRRAGVPLYGTHALRHTFGTQAVIAGIHPREIMELGGWSSMRMVERYTHVSDSRKVAAVQRLERASQAVSPEAE